MCLSPLCLALAIGGVAGYYGGVIDGVLQMITDAVRTVPAIPLFMAVAAFMPPEMTAEARFFYISLILGFIGWPTLARRVRTHLLTERNQEYILGRATCRGPRLRTSFDAIFCPALPVTSLSIW